jgi:2-oxoglutarate ferredoxin oxidoreductase subunit alpha
MFGNHAIVEGAIAAGCDYFAGYPITPASEVAERMSQRLPEVGGRFIQMEDELGSIFSVTGASLAGAKPMTATASAGYNYMQEGLGYAYAVEAPLVVVNVQRCRGENYATHSDVMQMRWGASGDYESICLAPSTVQELFDYTVKAFNFAERYRNPVTIISEMILSHMRERVVIPEPEEIPIVNRKKPTVPPEEFLPFKAEKNDVPPMPAFGEGYKTLYSLNPHSEEGKIDWDADVFEKLYERILGKIRNNMDDICEYETQYTDDAEILIVAYGTECRPALDAAVEARRRGQKVGMLKLVTVWPVPEKIIETLSRQVDTMIVMEMNVGKYFFEVERVAKTNCNVVPLTKNRGTIHTTEEVLKKIEGVSG